MIDNQTIARIGDAAVHTGTGGGLDISATEDVFSFDFVQTGGNSGKIGLSGSFSLADQGSDTLAWIDSGAVISGGALTLAAENTATHINFTGAVQLARQLGIGFSAGATLLRRDTEAGIGTRITDDDATPGSAGTRVDATGIGITATNSGQLTTVGVAGAMAGDAPGLTIKDSSGSSTSTAQPPQIGAGIAGVVSFDEVDDITRAYINDKGTLAVHDGSLVLAAGDTTGILAIAGAAALAKTPKTAIGIAGAFAYNSLDMTTEAFIAGATVTDAGSVAITAQRSGEVRILTAGVAVAAAIPAGSGATGGSTGGTGGGGGIGGGTGGTIGGSIGGALGGAGAAGGVVGAVSGSASLNSVSGATRAYLREANVTASGDLHLTADDDSSILAVAIGGAAAVSDSGGSSVAVTGSLSLNTIDNTIETSIGSGSVAMGGAVLLTATDKAAITADAGGVAIAISRKKAGSGSTAAVAVGAGVAVNEIGKKGGQAVRALLTDSMVTAGGPR